MSIPQLKELLDIVEDLRHKALFNESLRTYNALEWKAVSFEQKRIADELEAALSRLKAGR
jgi:arsenate reductase-like glutaredoxin family protein